MYNKKQMVNLTKAEAAGLYRMLKDWHYVCTKHQIAYWVTGGTLIGAVRHRGLVPWDDDGDVCIMRQDVPKLRALVPTFQKMGYFIEEGDEPDSEDPDNAELQQCRNKKDSCTWYMEPKSRRQLSMDIFVMERAGPLVTYADPYWRHARTGGEACYFLYQFVFPLVPVRFGNFWVFTPYNAVEHLNQCYGTDWAAMSRRLYDHRSQKWINSKPRRMTANEYQTLPAPRSTCTSRAPEVKNCHKTTKAHRSVQRLTGKELRIAAKAYGLPGHSRLNLKALRHAIAQLA